MPEFTVGSMISSGIKSQSSVQTDPPESRRKASSKLYPLVKLILSGSWTPSLPIIWLYLNLGERFCYLVEQNYLYY